MKYMKVILLLLTITTILSMNNVKAGTRVFAGIDIPGLKGTYTSGANTKDTWSNQQYENVDTVDKVNGAQKGIEARVKGIGASYVTAPKGAKTTLSNGSAGIGQTQGTYQLELREATSSIFGLYASGAWYLN